MHSPNSNNGGECITNTIAKVPWCNDAESHVGKLAKGCVMNDEDTNAHKLQ